MSYLKIEQHSTEWWQFKVGRVSGTRFGKLISGRDNGLDLRNSKRAVGRSHHPG